MNFDMLYSKGTWKILSVFLDQPWRQFYLRELIKKTGISPNNAVRALKELKKAGVFRDQKIGNIISYSMDASNEMSKKLLLLHHERRLQKLPDEFKIYINRLRRKLEKKNILSVVLFGSVSKGKAGNLSDIDILVVHEGKIGKERINGIFRKYSRYIQVIDFTKNEFNERYENGNELIINIIKNGIIICDLDFYYKYLFKPLPRPARHYIEGMLKETDKELESLWKMYRETKPEMITNLLHPTINHIATALILLSNQIPESSKNIPKELERLKEKRLSECYKITRKIWGGEMLEMSKKEIEDILNLIEDKLKECYIKLEEYR